MRGPDAELTAAEPGLAGPEPDALWEAQVEAEGQERQASRLARGFRNKWVLRAIVWGTLLLAWQVFALIKGPFYLPTLQDTVFDGFGKFFSQGYYLTFTETLRQLFIGFAIACAIAIPLGVLIGLSRIADDLLAPYYNTLFVTSLEALLPLLIIAFGTDLRFRIAVVVLFSAFFPLLNTAAGVRYIDPHLLETARAFGASPLRLFARVVLPAAAPSIVAGVRLGLGMALKGMIVAELWVIAGTGGLLTHFGRFRRLDIYFAIVIAIVVVAVLLNQGLLAVQRRLEPWNRAARVTT